MHSTHPSITNGSSSAVSIKDCINWHAYTYCTSSSCIRRCLKKRKSENVHDDGSHKSDKIDAVPMVLFATGLNWYSLCCCTCTCNVLVSSKKAILIAGQSHYQKKPPRPSNRIHLSPTSPEPFNSRPSVFTNQNARIFESAMKTNKQSLYLFTTLLTNPATRNLAY